MESVRSLHPEKNEGPYEISEGPKLFGLFYVPAIADEYIEMSDNETPFRQ